MSENVSIGNAVTVWWAFTWRIAVFAILIGIGFGVYEAATDQLQFQTMEYVQTKGIIINVLLIPVSIYFFFRLMTKGTKKHVLKWERKF